MEESAQSFRDVQLSYHTPEFISDIAAQQRIVRDFIKKKVDAIVLAPSDPFRLTGIVQKVNQAGIPILIIDSRLDKTRFFPVLLAQGGSFFCSSYCS